MLFAHGYTRLVDALPVVFIFALAPLALEGYLSLIHGHGVVEIPLSVAPLGDGRCSLIAWGQLIARTLLLLLHLFSLCQQSCVAFLFLFLLQGIDYTVDSLQSLFLRHRR